MSDSSPRGFRPFHHHAEEIVERSPRLRALTRRAQRRMRQPTSRLGSLRTDLPVLIRLVRAYAKGDYRRLPWKSIVLATATVVVVTVSTVVLVVVVVVVLVPAGSSVVPVGAAIVVATAAAAVSIS